MVGEAPNAQAAVNLLRDSGIRVLGVLEEGNGLGDGLALTPDVMAILVKPGTEMTAYRAGHEASLSGVAVLFVVPALGTPVAESLIGAVSGAVAVALPLSPSEIKERVVEALAARKADRGATPS